MGVRIDLVDIPATSSVSALERVTPQNDTNNAPVPENNSENTSTVIATTPTRDQYPGVLARLDGLNDLSLIKDYKPPKKTVLENGLTIIGEHTPGALSTYVSVWVNAGSMHEDPKNNGVAHFVEHMALKGTVSRSNIDIKKEMQRIGNNVNAFTSQQHTCYHARVLNKYVTDSLKLFFDMLLNSVIDQKEFDNERKVVLEELKMYKDSPEDHIGDLIYEVACKSHPMGRPVLGTTKIISGMQRETLLDFMSDFYTPDNITVSVAGDFDWDIVVELCRNLTSGVNRKKREVVIPELTVCPGVYIKNKQIEQTHLILSTKGLPVINNDRYALYIIDTALGGGFNSRLFNEIREKRGLAYTVKSETELTPLGGMFGIYTGIPGEDIECVLNVILEELKNVRERGLTSEELDMAKVQLVDELIMDHEGAEETANGNASEYFHHQRFVPLSESISKILVVTNEDIIRVAKEIFDPKYFTLVVLGPKKELPKGFEQIIKDDDA